MSISVFDLAALAAKAIAEENHRVGTLRILSITPGRVQLNGGLSELFPVDEWNVIERDDPTYYRYCAEVERNGVTFFSLMTDEQMEKFYEITTAGSA